MKKITITLLVLIIVFSTCSLAFANEITPPSESIETIKFDIPIENIDNGAESQYYLIVDEKGYQTYSEMPPEEVITKAISVIVLSAIPQEWHDEYVTMTIKVDVTDGAALKLFTAQVSVDTQSSLNEEHYSHFSVKLSDNAGTKHLSDEYSAWIPEGTYKISINMTKCYATNIYGEKNSVSNYRKFFNRN